MFQLCLFHGKMLCTPHCPSFSMLAIFSLHFHAAIDNNYKYMELSIDQDVFDPWIRESYSPEIEVIDGSVQIPQGTGWGVTLNEVWLNNANYTVSELQSLMNEPNLEYHTDY